jgi:hypothetical protein
MIISPIQEMAVARVISILKSYFSYLIIGISGSIATTSEAYPRYIFPPMNILRIS